MNMPPRVDYQVHRTQLEPLGTISGRSRDNLPNPKAGEGNPYVPENSPAIGDLFDLFNFSQKDQAHRAGGH